MMFYCPRCNRRITVTNTTTDYVHDCDSGNVALDQEDVVVIGNWEDYSGSGTKPKQEVLNTGLTNELQGTRAQVQEGEDSEDITRRGARASTHRQRNHQEYINLEDGGLS